MQMPISMILLEEKLLMKKKRALKKAENKF